MSIAPVLQEQMKTLALSTFLRTGISQEHAEARADWYIKGVVDFSEELIQAVRKVPGSANLPKLKDPKEAAQLEAAMQAAVIKFVEAAIGAYQSQAMREALRQIAAAEAFERQN